MTGLRRALIGLAVLGAVACGSAPFQATPPAPSPPLPPPLPSLSPPPPPGAELWLLGEVHDNAALHALRLQTLQTLLHQGARPALLMEQFDRERQGQIDALLQPAPGQAPDDAERDRTVNALVRLGGAAPGWQWDFYRPYLDLALRYRLPLVAANVSRSDARALMAQGLAAHGFEPAVPADIGAAQAGQIERSHCGQITAAQAGRMVNAQVARDQFMARQVAAQAGRGVVLLAGNGHVRKDVGVPRWLAPALQARTRVVGFVEAGPADDSDAAAFDQTISAAAATRNDPCAALRPAAASR